MHVAMWPPDQYRFIEVNRGESVEMHIDVYGHKCEAEGVGKVILLMTL